MTRIETLSDLENYLIATCNFKTRIKMLGFNMGAASGWTIRIEADTNSHGITKLKSELVDRVAMGAYLDVDRMDEWTQISQHEHCAVLDYT